MKKRLLSIALGLLLFTACNSEPSLERYIVDNAEAKNFTSVDVSPSLLLSNIKNLSAEDQQVMESFTKLNVLFYKPVDSADTSFDTRWTELRSIVKGQPKYEELFRFGSGSEGATLYMVGDSTRIDEFVLIGSAGRENGFGVVRFMGKDMSMEHAMKMMTLIQRAQSEGGIPGLENILK